MSLWGAISGCASRLGFGADKHPLHWLVGADDGAKFDRERPAKAKRRRLSSDALRSGKGGGAGEATESGGRSDSGQIRGRAGEQRGRRRDDEAKRHRDDASSESSSVDDASSVGGEGTRVRGRGRVLGDRGKGGAIVAGVKRRRARSPLHSLREMEDAYRYTARVNAAVGVVPISRSQLAPRPVTPPTARVTTPQRSSPASSDVSERDAPRSAVAAPAQVSGNVATETTTTVAETPAVSTLDVAIAKSNLAAAAQVKERAKQVGVATTVAMTGLMTPAAVSHEGHDLDEVQTAARGEVVESVAQPFPSSGFQIPATSVIMDTENATSIAPVPGLVQQVEQKAASVSYLREQTLLSSASKPASASAAMPSLADSVSRATGLLSVMIGADKHSVERASGTSRSAGGASAKSGAPSSSETGTRSNEKPASSPVAQANRAVRASSTDEMSATAAEGAVDNVEESSDTRAAAVTVRPDNALVAQLGAQAQARQRGDSEETFDATADDGDDEEGGALSLTRDSEDDDSGNGSERGSRDSSSGASGSEQGGEVDSCSDSGDGASDSRDSVDHGIDNVSPQNNGWGDGMLNFPEQRESLEEDDDDDDDEGDDEAIDLISDSD